MRAVFGVVAALGLAIAAGPATAQELTAEVRTWRGESWRLSDAALEVFYTIPAPPAEAAAPATGAMPASAAAPPGWPTPAPARPSPAPAGAAAKAQEVKLGHRAREAVTLHRGGAEIQVPLARIETLVFFRRPVPNSPLPHLLAAAHYHYAGTAVLTDGSRVEGDYVNLGTTILRGMTPQGRVDLPWEEIEVVRFVR